MKIPINTHAIEHTLRKLVTAPSRSNENVYSFPVGMGITCVILAALTVGTHAQFSYHVGCSDPVVNTVGYFYPLSSSGIHEIGATIRFGCPEGFILYGSEYASCKGNGQWEAIPKCLEYCDYPSRPQLIAIPNTDAITMVYMAGQNVSFKCEPGYKRVGPPAATCLGRNLWSDEVPKCVLAQIYFATYLNQAGCILPPLDWSTMSYAPTPPKNGRYPVGAKVTFTCFDRYKLYGSKYSYCLENGEWNALPECSDGCFMGSIDHAVLKPALEKGRMTYNQGTQVRIACSDGYRVLGAKVVTCKEDGSWTHSFTCAEVCDAVPNENLVYFPKPSADNHVYRVGQTVSFRCDAGYRLVGADKATCLKKIKWNAPIPRCEKIVTRCSAPTVSHSYASYAPKKRLYRVGDTVTWSCDPGFKLEGRTAATCSIKGKFFPARPICKGIGATVVKPGSYVASKRACKRPRDIPGGVITPVKEYYTHSSEVEFSCFRGRYLVGIARATCRMRGFDDNLPKCERIQCNPPRSPANGVVLDLPKKTYFFGDTVRYVCNSNFVMYGQSSAKCFANGQFFPGPPSCRPPSCRHQCDYKEGRPCQCDLYCVSRGDCCMDFSNHCRRLSY